eukprot:gb/GFBE01048383.1/.p1 GENE.gb/GFBE01048383.1/~~gb/GFBE01048383.1/.p1  ORF type:complete len:128 (+),score=35.14 gb/GFBE01048383.1/:1-384(+)
MSSADTSGSSGEPSPFDHKEQAPLPLEGSSAVRDGTADSEETTVVVDGNPVKLDKLGPLVVNADGTISRINNWNEMTEQEQQTTLRVIGKRNQQRLAKLRAEAESGAQAIAALPTEELVTRQKISWV